MSSDGAKVDAETVDRISGSYPPADLRGLRAAVVFSGVSLFIGAATFVVLRRELVCANRPDTRAAWAAALALGFVSICFAVRAYLRSAPDWLTTLGMLFVFGSGGTVLSLFVVATASPIPCLAFFD